MTGGACVTCGARAIINVVTAVRPGPAIYTHTLVAAVGVVARAAILAGVGHQLAFIHVIFAQLACVSIGCQECFYRHGTLKI